MKRRKRKVGKVTYFKEREQTEHRQNEKLEKDKRADRRETKENWNRNRAQIYGNVGQSGAQRCEEMRTRHRKGEEERLRKCTV